MPKLTPHDAVLRGQLWINLPVTIFIVAFVLAGSRLGEGTTLVRLVISVLAGGSLGFVTAWLWWSSMVPRWRDWVVDSGLSPADVNDLAIRSRLIWPAGSRFERTEFRRRDGRQGW